MRKADIIKTFDCLKGKTLINLIFNDKTINDEDSSLILVFSNFYSLKIQSFWRISDKNKILVMESERFLLPNFNAPEKDYLKLPYNNSLLFNNLELIRSKFINSCVVEVDISDTLDCIIKFENSLKIQIIINCRSNDYMYYGLFNNDEKISEVRFDWDTI